MCIYRQKWRHFDCKEESRYPYWANKYFVKREHLRAYYMFFGNDAVTPDEAAVAARREAFRQQIGVVDVRSDNTRRPLARYVRTV